ncbi:hemolysin E [Escherichia coli]|nr:hemolysin E [Escherichia coli]
MTEIVADKTVEVVKNAIETADGALDLYNKYLDQVIPWQTFDETIKELSRFKQEYSQAASVLVGDIKTLLMGKRKLTAVCSHQTRIGNLDAHLI